MKDINGNEINGPFYLDSYVEHNKVFDVMDNYGNRIGSVFGGDMAKFVVNAMNSTLNQRTEMKPTEQQPAPDVSALVEALERVMYCNEVGSLPESVQQAVSDALAALTRSPAGSRASPSLKREKI